MRARAVANSSRLIIFLIICFQPVACALSVWCTLFALSRSGGRAVRAPSLSYGVLCTVLYAKTYYIFKFNLILPVSPVPGEPHARVRRHRIRRQVLGADKLIHKCPLRPHASLILRRLRCLVSEGSGAFRSW